MWEGRKKASLDRMGGVMGGHDAGLMLLSLPSFL